jgi:MFS family permease
MYMGTMVGGLIQIVIGDLVGRKRLMIACLATNALGLITVILSVNIHMASAGLFLSTVGIQTAFNICFYFLT